MLLSICSKKSSYVNSAQLGSSSEISTQEASALASAGHSQYIDYRPWISNHFPDMWRVWELCGCIAHKESDRNLHFFLDLQYSNLNSHGLLVKMDVPGRMPGSAGCQYPAPWIAHLKAPFSATKWSKKKPVVTCVLRISFRTSSPNKSKSWISSKLPALEFPSESQEGLSKNSGSKIVDSEKKTIES